MARSGGGDVAAIAQADGTARVLIALAVYAVEAAVQRLCVEMKPSCNTLVDCGIRIRQRESAIGAKDSLDGQRRRTSAAVFDSLDGGRVPALVHDAYRGHGGGRGSGVNHATQIDRYKFALHYKYCSSGPSYDSIKAPDTV